MKYGVNRVTLVGNVGEVPRVTERDGEAFVANFPLATNEFYKNKEGEEVSKTEWLRIVNMYGTFSPTVGVCAVKMARSFAYSAKFLTLQNDV